MPMPPSPSPTTVSAAKPSTRPPLTTLVTRLTATIFSRSPSPRSSPICIFDACNFAMAAIPSEFESRFARGVRQRLDAAVIPVTPAVESDRFDAGLFRALGDALADLGRGLDVAAVARPQLGLGRRRGRQHLGPARVYHLGVDVTVGAVHGQPHRVQLGNLGPGLARPAQALLVFIGHIRLLLLGFLDYDLLVGIAHALALVRLRAAVGAHLGGHLPDLLPVHALDHDLGLGRRLDLDAFRHRVGHRVREAEREIELVALALGAVADADQLQLLLEALGDAVDHVRDQRPQRAGHRVGMPRIARRLELEAVLHFFDLDVALELLAQAAEGTLDQDLAGRDGHLDLFRQDDREVSDSGHGVLRSGDDAEHFAADAQAPRLAVGHHAARCRDDRHAQAVHHLRQLVLLPVDAQPRSAHALDLLDHRLAGIVLEADLELGFAVAIAQR